MRLSHVPLDGRVREVASLLLEGLCEKEVAARLHISRHTVHDHVKTLYRLLGVRSRPEFFAYAIAQDLRGLTPPNPARLAELREEVAAIRRALREASALFTRVGRALNR